MLSAGHVSRDLTFVDLARRGLQPDELVWYEGLADWTRAADLPELAEVVDATPRAGESEADVGGLDWHADWAPLRPHRDRVLLGVAVLFGVYSLASVTYQSIEYTLPLELPLYATLSVLGLALAAVPLALALLIDEARFRWLAIGFALVGLLLDTYLGLAHPVYAGDGTLLELIGILRGE